VEENSSDTLADLQCEVTVRQEASMAIDNPNLFNDLNTTFGRIVIIKMTIFSGKFGYSQSSD
jgi:hypothetical protein